jgi:hypothetical protein
LAGALAKEGRGKLTINVSTAAVLTLTVKSAQTLRYCVVLAPPKEQNFV